MKSKLIVVLFLALLIGVVGQAFGAGTLTVIPSTIPKGAYVNGPGGASDDNFFYQVLTFKAGATHAAASTMTITFPTGVRLAQVNSTQGYATHVSLYYRTAGAATASVTSATQASIVLTFAGAATAAGDSVRIFFPIVTDVAPTVDSGDYYLTFSDNDSGESLGDGSGAIATFADPGSLGTSTFKAIMTGDNDSTSTYGETYPVSTAAPLWDALLDLVPDGGEANVDGSNNPMSFDLDGTESGAEVVYYVWASRDSTLAHIDTTGTHDGVLPAIRNSTGAWFMTNELTTGGTDLINTTGLPEGNWYFFISCPTLTRDFVLGRSGKINVRHYPVVKILGWDRDHNGFDNETPFSDDASVTLDSGDYIDIGGTAAGSAGFYTDVDLYVSVDDYDDNATVKLFYSTNSGLTTSNLVVAGADTARVVQSLTGAIELATGTLYENAEDNNGFISWNWDVAPQGTSFITANTYTLYAVANDGKHQYLLKAAGAGGSANISVNIKHSPFMKLDALAEYDTDATPSAPPVLIQLNTLDDIMISWGKTGVAGDMDVDDSCVISFYIYSDTDDAPDFTSTQATGLAASANAYLIGSGLLENLESKESSEFKWNIKEFYESTSFTPTNGTTGRYSLYAIIDENKTGGTQRVIALNTYDDDGAGTNDIPNDGLVLAGETLDRLTFNNTGYTMVFDPPADGVTVAGSETYRFDLTAFDIDEDANIGIFILKAGNPTVQTAVSGEGPATVTVANMVTATAGAADGVAYCLTSINGTRAGGAGIWPKENTDTYYEVTVRPPSDGGTNRYTTDLDGDAQTLAEGEYWVYIGVDPNNNNFVDGTEVLYRSLGTINFINISNSNISPQRNLMLTPTHITMALGDSIDFDVRGIDGSGGVDNVIDADLIDLYIAVSKQYFTLVDADADSTFRPFTDNVPGSGSLIANTFIDDAVNNRWILHATAFNGGNRIDLGLEDTGAKIAGFQVVCKGTDAGVETSDAITFLTSGDYVSRFVNDGHTVAISFEANAVTMGIQPRGIVHGETDFEGRTNPSLIVNLELRERGSYVASSDSAFIAANDGKIYAGGTLADSLYSDSGIQYKLGPTGAFILYQVPPGEWDLVMAYNRYLSKLVEINVRAGLDSLNVEYGILTGGDSIGYTDSSSVIWPNNRIDSDDINRISDSNIYLQTSSTAPDTSWNAPNNWKWADINEDDIVDAVDLAMATGNFTGGNPVDGAQPVYAKPAVSPDVSNQESFVEMLNLPDNLKAGQTYTIQVVVRNTQSVKGYFVDLNYDKTALQVSDVSAGDFLGKNTYAFPTYRDGKVGFTNTVFGKEKYAFGDGILAEFTFTALKDMQLTTDMLTIGETTLVNASYLKDVLIDNNTTNVNDMPVVFSLGQNFPNPFNPTTTIRFSIPKRGNVELKIYDILGRHVTTLVSDARDAGNYSVVWNAKDLNGSEVAAGVYFYTIKADNFSAVKKMLLLK